MSGRRRLPFLPVLAAVLTLLAAAAAEPVHRAHFYFVQLTDTHWGARDGVRLTWQVVEAVNALPMPIEFVVHTGDMLADSIQKEEVVAKGLAAMSRLKVPVHYVPGNHDILTKKPKSTMTLYRRHFGPVSTAAEYRGVVCLFAYTEPLADGITLEGYDPLQWLRDRLRLAGNKPVLIFQHSPSVSDLVKNETVPGWPEAERKAWEQLLRTSTVKAVVAGHFHRDEMHWIGDIPVYIGSAVARFWDRQPSFRVYEYRDGRLGYWTVYL